jgi:hypothetical protein
MFYQFFIVVLFQIHCGSGAPRIRNVFFKILIRILLKFSDPIRIRIHNSDPKIPSSNFQLPSADAQSLKGCQLRMTGHHLVLLKGGKAPWYFSAIFTKYFVWCFWCWPCLHGQDNFGDLIRIKYSNRS